MATTSTPFDDTAYVLISSATDVLAQNSSNSPIRVVLAASLPAAGTTDYGVLPPFDGITKTGGVPAGNIYMRAEESKKGKGTAFV